MNSSIVIGHISKAHGVRGEVAVVVYSDHPEQFTRGFVFGGWDHDLVIENVRSTASGLVVKFDGIDDRTVAEQLRGTQLTMSSDRRRSLDDGEFWPDELAGLVVVDEHGVERGVVKAVITGVAQDRLVIELAGGQVDVPFVDELVPNVDLGSGRIVVMAAAGVFEDPL